MNAAQIRSWCIVGKPRPVALRVRTGKETNVVPVGKSYAKLAATVEAMQPDLIEALDGNGNVLRAIRPEDVDDTEDDDEPKSKAGVLDGIPTDAFDAETVRWKLFAELLSEAYKHSNTSNTAAFDRLVQIAEIGARRAEAAEKTVATYDRMRRQDLEERMSEIDEMAKQAGGDAPLLGQMLQTFLSSQGLGGGGPKPPTTTNGKGH